MCPELVPCRASLFSCLGGRGALAGERQGQARAADSSHQLLRAQHQSLSSWKLVRSQLSDQARIHELRLLQASVHREAVAQSASQEVTKEISGVGRNCR